MVYIRPWGKRDAEHKGGEVHICMLARTGMASSRPDMSAGKRPDAVLNNP